MAKPRTPSSAGMCPRRLGRGLTVSGARAPEVAIPPRFDGGVTCACADIRPAYRARSGHFDRTPSCDVAAFTWIP